MRYIDFEPADPATLQEILAKNYRVQIDDFIAPGGVADDLGGYLERRGPSGPTAKD